MIEAYGGLSAVGKQVGISRQLVDLWREKGVPLEKCSFVADKLYKNYQLRWALNFTAVYEYEKWRGLNTLEKYWHSTVKAVPIEGTAKEHLMRKFNGQAKKSNK